MRAWRGACPRDHPCAVLKLSVEFLLSSTGVYLFAFLVGPLVYPIEQEHPGTGEHDWLRVSRRRKNARNDGTVASHRHLMISGPVRNPFLCNSCTQSGTKSDYRVTTVKIDQNSLMATPRSGVTHLKLVWPFGTRRQLWNSNRNCKSVARERTGGRNEWPTLTSTSTWLQGLS